MLCKKGVACAYILDVGEYSLHLVESPLVAVSEIPMAMRAGVLRDLINFTRLKRLYIDTVDVPVLRARDNTKMIYAATIQKQQVEKNRKSH